MTRPPIKKISNLKIAKPETTRLNNGILLYAINAGDQLASRIDIITEGGRCDGRSQLDSELLAACLREGTKSKSAKEIAEHLDFYGSWLSCEASAHNTSISLYTINRYFNEALPIVAEMTTKPTFPSHELGNLKTLAINRQKSNQEKVAYLAVRNFMRCFFGESHNLGKISSAHDIEAIDDKRLISFHSQWFHPQNTIIVISGLVTDRMLQSVADEFGAESGDILHTESASDFPAIDFQPQIVHTDKPGTLQSAIRIGIPAIHRTHPDYIPLRILTTALGGYFGSRLMTNIREEKGYTYGISATLCCYRNCAFISISSQCDTNYTTEVVDEIKREMNKLRSTPLPKEELERVRSAMLCDLARTLDTPFSIADYYSSLLRNHISDDYFDRQIETILSATPRQLQEMAIRYLDADKMLISIAGDRTALHR